MPRAIVKATNINWRKLNERCIDSDRSSLTKTTRYRVLRKRWLKEVVKWRFKFKEFELKRNIIEVFVDRSSCKLKKKIRK